MVCKCKGWDILGWFVVDKLVGMILIVVVNKVCWVMVVKKVGYVGMLDFEVMGVLVVVLGEVIKIVFYIIDSLKVYMFMVWLGVVMNMDDVEGEVIVILDLCFFDDDIKVVFGQFVGDIMQVLFKFLVVKIDGECVYKLVCDDEDFEIVVCFFWVEELVMID